jgi:glycosyltransferase involved in cell wall biosynthesis
VVIFSGRVPHAQVERYYSLIDVLVYPRISTRVTELVTPLKPLEAMAQGKLVLASDVGGHREMVFPGRNGLLFEAGEAGSLAQVGLELIARKGDWPALREAGRMYVAASRSWERNVKIYDELYRRLLFGCGDTLRTPRR